MCFYLRLGVDWHCSQMEEETRIRIGTNAGGILDASKSMDEEDEDLDEATALGE